jgi:hypothetical protein
MTRFMWTMLRLIGFGSLSLMWLLSLAGLIALCRSHFAAKRASRLSVEAALPLPLFLSGVEHARAQRARAQALRQYHRESLIVSVRTMRKLERDSGMELQSADRFTGLAPPTHEGRAAAGKGEVGGWLLSLADLVTSATAGTLRIFGHS